MKNKIIYCFIFIMVVLLGGCLRGVKVDEPPVEEGPVTPREEVIIVPEKKYEIDYESIELEILEIQQIEEKPEPYNSYNPRFSHNETYIAFEISHEMYNKIYVYQMAITIKGNGRAVKLSKRA